MPADGSAGLALSALQATFDRPTIDAMRRHAVFADLHDEQLEHLLLCSRLQRVSAGQLVYERGQTARHFFLVLEGQVNLSLHSKGGEVKIVDILGPGEVFAEAMMFMDVPRYQMTARAVSTTRLVRFGHQDYLDVLRESPETCLRMLGHLTRRLHGCIQEIGQLTLESATHRLVRLLDKRMPAGHPGPCDVELPKSRQEVAAWLGMKPETLSRALRSLADAGVIEVRGRAVHVPDRERLLDHLDAIPA